MFSGTCRYFCRIPGWVFHNKTVIFWSKKCHFLMAWPDYFSQKSTDGQIDVALKWEWTDFEPWYCEMFGQAPWQLLLSTRFVVCRGVVKVQGSFRRKKRLGKRGLIGKRCQQVFFLIIHLYIGLARIFFIMMNESWRNYYTYLLRCHLD